MKSNVVLAARQLPELVRSTLTRLQEENVSTPVLPPYLGSYEDLVNALLHNPFLGGGRGPGPRRLKADDVELNP
jgi:hypothetical protein